MKVLIVGDRPSSLNVDPKVPFKGAKCEKRLNTWIDVIGIRNCKIINQSDFEYDEIVDLINMYNGLYTKVKVVALGNNASKALKSLEHFKLPHPSGLNRKLNDKKYEKQQLKLCKAFLNG